MAAHGVIRHHDVVKHTLITGLQGHVDAITVWANGCERITIQPDAIKDGQPAEPFTVDVEYVEVVTPYEGETPDRPPHPAESAGGARSTPSRARDPR